MVRRVFGSGWFLSVFADVRGRGRVAAALVALSPAGCYMGLDGPDVLAECETETEGRVFDGRFRQSSGLAMFELTA